MNNHLKTLAIWDELEKAQTSDANWRPVPNSQTLRGGYFCSQDGEPGIIVFSRTPFKLPIPEYASLKVQNYERKQDLYALTVTLTNHRLRELFAIICTRILEELPKCQSADGATFLKKQLSKWKELLRNGHPILTEEAERGLFCELEILNQTLDKMPSAEALQAWTGPDEKSQDFQFGTYTIEVKSLFQQAGKVKISSLEQLDCTNPLFLSVLSLFIDETGQTLRQKVESLRARLEDDSASLAILNEKLSLVGYSEELQSIGSGKHYSIGASSWYLASDPQFPSLTRSKTPAGVVDATYTISVGAIEQFKTESPL